MAKFSTAASDSPYKGSGNLTREQFYFYEMRTTARLMVSGLSDEEITEKIASENLFQFPTERTVKRAANACIVRLRALEDPFLIQAVAEQDSTTARQICLYAMMRQYRLVWDFMITVVGEKYRLRDYSFTRSEINIFFMRLQEQDDTVAGWSEATVKRIISTLLNILAENEYLDSSRSSQLNPVLICGVLENAIRESGHEPALAAFNCPV